MTTFPASSAEEDLRERVGANLARVRERIGTSGRDPSSVRVLAVTKTFGAEVVRAAFACGLHAFGENYVDELCDKRADTHDLPARWHFLGALQSNKIARVARCADVVSSVARVKEIDRLAALSPGHHVDIQVDFTGAAQRNGASPQDVAGLAAHARASGLALRGLMVVAPRGEDAARRAFAATRALADELGVVERSMGMSEDLELACEMGSTEVRLGRALFGPRTLRGSLA